MTYIEDLITDIATKIQIQFPEIYVCSETFQTFEDAPEEQVMVQSEIGEEEGFGLPVFTQDFSVHIKSPSIENTYMLSRAIYKFLYTFSGLATQDSIFTIFSIQSISKSPYTGETENNNYLYITKYRVHASDNSGFSKVDILKGW